MQEYVDTPVLVKFKLDRHTSLDPDEVLEPPTNPPRSVFPGAFYAVRVAGQGDGYVVCKVINSNNNNFLATCYEKSDSIYPEEMCFVESKNSYFDLTFVISDLLSVRGTGDFVIVNYAEIQEVVISCIENT